MRSATKQLFNNFFHNIAHIFSRRNLNWHLLAIVLTAIIVVGGFDWTYYSATRNDILNAILFPAVGLGFILPILGPAALLLFGAVKKNKRAVNTGLALWQAALLGLLLSFFYKAFTGRDHPQRYSIGGDVTRIFHFGFLRGGVFWGWPSSHTTVAFATAFTLFTLYPK